jgi:hypothetical protein
MMKTPILIALAAAAAIGPADGRAEGWRAVDSVALSSNDNGVSVGVIFAPDGGCRGVLTLDSPQYTRTWDVAVDGEPWERAVAVPLTESAEMVAITEAAIADLRAGHAIHIQTDVGWVTMSLAGSRRAIDTARAACLAARRGSSPAWTQL